MSNPDLYRTYVTQVGFGLEAAANQAAEGVFDGSTWLVIGDEALDESANPAALTDLNNQVRSYPATIEQDEDDPTIWIARAEISADDGGFYIREAGIRVDDRDTGDLYAYARQAGDYKPELVEGQGKSYTIRLKFIPGNAEVINAKIDPSVQFATPTDLDNAIKAHEAKPDPHPQYIQTNAHKRATLFMPVFCAGAGWTPDPDLYAPELGQKCYQSEYPTVYDIVSTQLTNVIDEDTKAASIADGSNTYVGYFGLGSDENGNFFTTRNKSLFMHDKAAGVYGSAGEFKQDHMQNVTGELAIKMTSANTYAGLSRTVGVFNPKTIGNAAAAVNAATVDVVTTNSSNTAVFDLSNVARTQDYTDSMGAFSDAYICLPKGEF